MPVSLHIRYRHSQGKKQPSGSPIYPWLVFVVLGLAGMFWLRIAPVPELHDGNLRMDWFEPSSSD